MGHLQNYIHLLILLFISNAILAQDVFTAVLSGQQEVSPVISSGEGIVTATLDGNELKVGGEFSGLTGTVATEIAGGAHIHLGLAGQNGGIVFMLSVDLEEGNRSGSFDPEKNTFQLDQNQSLLLQERRFYVNIHTSAFPSGELRGQLLPESDVNLQSILTGNQEVPAILTSGYGVAMLEIQGKNLIVTGSFQGLTSPFDPSIGGGAHIHLASAGQNGSVAVAITATVSPDGLSGTFEAVDNTFELSDENITAIMAREAYLNIHTQDFPSGEIRGQVTGLATTVFRAHLSGSNEKPFVDSRGQGVVLAEYYATDNSLLVFGSFEDMSSEIASQIAGGAHIHAGYAGQNGGVVIALNVTSSEDSRSGLFEETNNMFELDTEDVMQLLNRGLYVNVHSINHPSGELRGQLLPLAQYHFTAYMGGSQEFPPIAGTGNGAVKVEWLNNEIVVSGSFSNLMGDFDANIGGGAHLHLGYPGQNGGVVIPLNATLDAELRSGIFDPEQNTFEINEMLSMQLGNRMIYANIHTTSFPSGEIRGQVLREAQAYYQSSLSGSQEVPAVVTSGRGAVMIERTGNSIIPIGAFSQLTGPFDPNIAGGAHIHNGYAGSNGGIVLGLNPEVSAEGLTGTFDGSEIIEIDEELYQQLLDRSLYINIHTEAMASGEIRGQITGQQIALFRAHLAGANELHGVESGGSGVVLAELNNGNAIMVSGSFQNMESPLATEIAGGVHIHTAPAGLNGPVALVLNPDTDDGLNGIFKGSENISPIDNQLAQQFVNRNTYVNIHSVMYQAGELRGQLAADANYVYTALLGGAQEVPAITSPGHGAIKLEWNGNKIIATGAAAFLWDEIATEIGGGAHIHMGLPGENGAVVYALNFIEPDNEDDIQAVFLPESNTFDLTEEVLEMLMNRGLYVNIHSELFQAGELRGQLMREALAYYHANLYGSHEVPSVLTTGMGSIMMEWDGSHLKGIGKISNLMSEVATNIAGGAHIHIGLPGQNGPVEALINVELDEDMKGGTVMTDNNTIETNEDFVELLRNRRLYVNIHTDLHPSGEIRGHITGQSISLLRANLAGSNEIPAVMTSGRGTVLIEAKPDFSLKYYGSFEGLTGEVATNIAGGIHIHQGPPGALGPILIPLEFNLDEGNQSGEFLPEIIPFDPENLATFILPMFRFTYVNIHTSLAPSGEIRGALMGDSQYEFTGVLSGLQEVLPVNTLGNGGMKAEWSGNRLILSGSVFNLFSDIDFSIAGGAHIHEGLPGQNGGIVAGLTPDNSFFTEPGNAFFLSLDNVVQLEEEDITKLMNRELYVNIHTQMFPSGEVRAQMMGEAENYFMANLAGSHEVPPVRTEGNGSVVFEKNGNTYQAVGSFSDLNSSFDPDIGGGAHVHNGLAGQNGDVEAFLNTDLDESRIAGAFRFMDNILELDNDITASRKYYVNIHTTDNPGGELRGQLTPINIGNYSTNLSGSNEIPYVVSSGNGQLLTEFDGVSVKTSGSFSSLDGEVDTNIAGGAHLHVGGPHENGDVLVTLNPDLNMDMRSGNFELSENTTPVDQNLFTRLLFGELYANIHTTTVPSGELRGQVLPQINFYPEGNSMITLPPDESTIVLEGNPQTKLIIEWTEDTDDNELAYIWELSLDPGFELSVLRLNAGLSTSLEFTYEDIDELLEQNNVPVGLTLELYHRAIATDGSLQTPGATSVARITRGILTSNENMNLINQNFRVLPNLISYSGNARIEVEVNQPETGRFNILDLNGRILSSERADLTNGLTSIPLNVSGMKAGTYFVQWIKENGKSTMIKFMIN